MSTPLIKRTDLHVGVALAAVTCANPLVGAALGIPAITAYGLSLLKKDIKETLRPRLAEYQHTDLTTELANFQGEFIGLTTNEIIAAQRIYQKMKRYQRMQNACPIL